jgi:hypothetical protein
VISRGFFFAAIVAAVLGLAGCDKLLPNLKSPFNSVDVPARRWGPISRSPMPTASPAPCRNSAARSSS